jgi:tRNA-modifying protein YgfZ
MVEAREYAAGREGAGLVRLERGLLAVTGPLRQKFLNNILSNDVQARTAGQGCLAALMDVKGHLLTLMRVLVAPDAVVLETPGDRLDLLEGQLVHYRVATPVRFERRPLAVLALIGARAAEVLARAGVTGLPSGREDHLPATLAGHEVRIASAGDLPSGFVLHVLSDAVAAVSEGLRGAGAEPIGSAALDVLRVEGGRPWYGPDITEANLLHETGLLREYHSSTKGCYIGQEVVARLEGRGGNVNKRMSGLKLSAPAQAGDAVSAEGREVGRVTTAAVSPRLGPIALGYVHRSHFEPGTVLEVAGSPATVSRLPFEG